MSIIKKIMTHSLLILSVVALQLVKVSYIVGSHAAGFKLSNCVLPLSGYWGGFMGSALVSMLLLAIRWSLSAWGPFSLLVYHIPGFCASLYHATQHWMIRCMLPLVCIALFIAHPVGMQAWAYTLVWLLPVAVNVMGSSSFFTHALSSTLVAHAVGSVLWIYGNPMTAGVWLALIPVVYVERLSFAIGMTLVRSYVLAAYAAYKKVFARIASRTTTLA